jgi:hypothetical protein
MNWGNKLLLVFAVFAGGISFLVYRCMRTPVDLVSNEYYQDELAYQAIIDGTNHANALSTKVVVGQDDRGIFLKLPREMQNKPVTGTILFYCASEAARDRRLNLRPNADARQDLSYDKIEPAHYLVKVQWQSEGKDYYSEQPVEIH